MIKKINVGLIGFGNVGSGVVKILKSRRALLRDKIDVDIVLKKICDKDISSRRDINVERELLTGNADEILNDPSIDIVMELMGGIHPAKEFIIKALRNGKHVITANKALLAEEGSELFALSRERGKAICFEASCGAGIPIIKSLREGLVANKFSNIYGIINGTSNFVLSEMAEKDCSFSEALKEAKRRGFAESNPSLDIDGIDSAHKLILLIYLCFGRFVNMKDIFIEGISHISISDINYAQELGLEIKLLAIAKKVGDELEVRVHPTMIPREHLLSSVGGIFNAIHVDSDLAGELLFYGPGAGQMCAASGVVSDLVDLIQDVKAGLFKPTMNVVLDGSIKKLRRIDEIESRYYIRFMAIDKPGVLARISGVLSTEGISIASVTQKERKKQEIVPIVMIIHEAKERNLRQALEKLDRLNVFKEKSVAIRIEEV